MLKGTQRRVVVGGLALTTLASVVLVELPTAAPASVFPPGHKVFTFNYKVVATTRIAKLKKAFTPPVGTYKGAIDLVTGQLKGGIKLPASFPVPLSGLSGVTAAITQVKPVTGQLELSNSKVNATTTFVMRIVTAYAPGSSAQAAALPPLTLPTLPLPTLPVPLPTLPPLTLPSLPVQPPGTPPVNLVGKSCISAKPIKLVLNGVARRGSSSGSKLTGKFTLPKFKSCGVATPLLNQALPGPGNTFSAVGTPPSSTPSLPITLPSLPITLPSLPINLPPITLPGG